MLAIDAGNSHIVLGLGQIAAERLGWRSQWRISTDRRRTADEYVALLHALMSASNMPSARIEGAAVSCVVPQITRSLLEFAERSSRGPVLNVSHVSNTAMSIRYDPPGDVGPDRIVNAVAAHRLYGGPAIVVDFGTATTFDAISESGEYLGGAIAPGIEISVDALASHAARLSRIELQVPESAIGRSTSESMQSGIVLGHVELTDGMVRRFRELLGPAATVIATGGLASLIAAASQTIAHVDPWLTLEGLRMLWVRAHAPALATAGRPRP